MRVELIPWLDTQWLNAVNVASFINTFSISHVERKGNQVMPCYASAYIILKSFHILQHLGKWNYFFLCLLDNSSPGIPLI